MRAKRRTLGSGDAALEVSAEGLGCFGMTPAYEATDDVESTATIHAALDAGICYLDTADVYGNFRNEELVGRAIAGRRDEVVLATKFGDLLVVVQDGTAIEAGDHASLAHEAFTSRCMTRKQGRTE